MTKEKVLDPEPEQLLAVRNLTEVVQLWQSLRLDTDCYAETFVWIQRLSLWCPYRHTPPNFKYVFFLETSLSSELNQCHKRCTQLGVDDQH